MKIEVIRGGELACAKRELSGQEVRSYHRMTALGQRLGMYGFPLFVLAWLFIVTPPGEFHLGLVHVMLFFAILLFTPLIHELVHMVALPSRALHSDARFFVKIDGIRSGFFFRPGGEVIGIQFAWISVLPFLLLTLAPLCLQIFGVFDSLLLGIFAGYNFALSGIDLIQAFLVARSSAFKRLS